MGEIEHQLSLLAHIDSALVMVIPDEAGTKRLVAYIRRHFSISDEAWTDRDLIGQCQQQLALQLPDYMVPQTYICIEQWPLTANGKIDKRALPQPDRLAQQAVYVAPANSTEQALVTIWGALLGLETDSLSVTANFFALGGHSLLATDW
ncbi:hypothetical protein AC626_23485 [Pseudoalteromonas rubra]|uniref:Carrier domain-containing protein n=1 Tax=Pseudoalteromonas rubra TaxID=43658 RepID=A0A0L0ELX8_9GAMM|nr:hypothetical protein AC626_23485 [Pseudoalteromonas rubra]